MEDIQSSENGGDSSLPNNVVQPTCTAIEVHDDYDHYIEVPFAILDKHGFSCTSIISHLANLSLGNNTKDRWTGVLSVPGSKALEATETYIGKLEPDSDVPSLKGWELAIDPLTSFPVQPSTESSPELSAKELLERSHGQLCRFSMSRNLPDGSRVEGRFGWDPDRNSVYLGFRFPGVPLGAVWPDTASTEAGSTEVVSPEVVSPEASTTTPVRGTRMYIPSNLVDPLLDELHRRRPGWRLPTLFAPNLPDGAIPGCIGATR
jgi:hypothetical protein